MSCGYETVSDNGVVFERTDNDSCEIYSMNADGSDRVNLTNNDVWDADPAPSPNGTKIAYVSDLGNDNSEIHVMNADGSGKVQLTDTRDWETGPAWSPDGSQIVFSVLQDLEISEIRTMKADGSDLTALAKATVSSEGYLLSPAWSPLGTYIAYVREGFHQSECQGCSAIFVMNADGSNPTQVSHNTTGNDPAWSPDGTKILYTSGSGIYSIPLDGSGEMKLAGTEGGDSHPSWSPDGKTIAFQSYREQSFVGDFDIYVMSTDRSGLKRLTDNRNSSSPAWSRVPLHPLVQRPDCTSGWTRLQAGNEARVSQETTTPNRVRAGSSTAEEVVVMLHPGTVMKVIEGPVCADGLIFWRVENESIPGGAGWTAEGDGSEYWLEPIVP